MAELTLTEEERRSPTFLEWDNESLGLAVRKIAVMLNDGHGGRSIKATAAAVFLIEESISMGSECPDDLMTVSIDGATSGGKSLGGWDVVVCRKTKSQGVFDGEG